MVRRFGTHFWPGGSPRQMLKEEVEKRMDREPLAWGGLTLDKLISGPRDPSYVTARGVAVHN